MAGVSIDALQSEFECFSVKIDDLTGGRLIELCDKFGLSAEEVSDQWMAYASGKKLSLTDQPIPIDHFGPFEIYLSQSKKVISTPKAIKKEPRSTSTPNRKPLSTGGLGLASKYEEALDADIDIASGYTTPQNRDKLAKRLHTTPEEDGIHKRMISDNGSPHIARPTTKVELFRGDFTSSSSPSSPMTPSQNYQSRTNKGKVLESFNCDPSFSFSTSSSSSGLPILVGVIDSASGQLLSHPPKSAFKFMMQRPKEVAESLDYAVDDLLETFISDNLGAVKTEDESSSLSLSHVGVPHHERVLVGGRICCDGVGRINAKSLLLEGTRDSSGGASIALDVSQLPRYSFFPGQTVLMQGTNPSGKAFLASNLIASTKKSAMTSTTITPTLLSDTSLFVAVGPFTTSDSDSYEPLGDFLKLVTEEKPRVCLFLGPFVDAKNELIVNNNFQSGDGTHEGLFSVVLDRIKQCMDSLGGNCQAVLIPSARDLHHAFVYPQPPFPSEQNQLVKSFWDPSLLSIGGVVVGVTSTDILFHLGAEEISFPPGSSDRLARLCSHILAQRSFYPLQPASEDVNMDYSLYERHATFSQNPQILILPSELKQFIKDVSGCVCVNPGRLSKGQVGGSFAKILLPSKSVSSKTIKSHILKI